MKLIGYVGGIEVKFDFYPPNTFKAEIPKNLEGSYIVQLKVVDSAGNETNKTDIYMFIDFQKMIFKILEKNFIEKSKKENYINKELNNKYSCRELW